MCFVGMNGASLYENIETRRIYCIERTDENDRVDQNSCISRGYNNCKVLTVGHQDLHNVCLGELNYEHDECSFLDWDCYL